MSYDRVWIHDSEKHELHEQREFEIRGESNELEFTTKSERQYNEGNFVVLVAGANLLFEEIFLFATSADAQAFYDHGFGAFESFVGEDDVGCGFQAISLYRGQRQVGSKSVGPTKRSQSETAR